MCTRIQTQPWEQRSWCIVCPDWPLGSVIPAHCYVCLWYDLFTCVTRLCLWHDKWEWVMSVTWLVCMCMIWLIHMSDSFVFVAWHIQMCDWFMSVTWLMCSMIWRIHMCDSFVFVAWLHMCDLFMSVTWLMCISVAWLIRQQCSLFIVI